MSKHYLVAALALAAIAAGRPALAAAPGTSNDGIAHALHISESVSENHTVDISASFPAGVCDGFLVMGKEAQPAGNGVQWDPTNPTNAPSWSDVVVFHNGTALPTGVCDATVHFMTIVSRPDISQPRGAGSDFPAAGCLLNNGAACPPILPDFAALPAFLQGLTVAQVNGGAGGNATVYQQEAILTGTRNDGVIYTPTGAAAGGTYTIFSDVPALPPWGFALLGGTLLGTAIIVLRRRGRDTLSTTV